MDITPGPAQDRVRRFVELLEDEAESIRLMLNRGERRLRIDINQIERRDRELYDGYASTIFCIPAGFCS